MATYSSVLAWRIPRDGGAWWAAIYGVAQSQTQLKGLSPPELGAPWGPGEAGSRRDAVRPQRDVSLGGPVASAPRDACAQAA